MTSLLLAAAASFGVYLIVVPRSPGEPRRASWRERAEAALRRTGLVGVTPSQFGATVIGFGAAAALLTTLLFGPGIGAILVGVIASAWPVATWRARRASTRRAAQDHWPRLIEELRVLVGPMGRPIPQALLDVGARGPVELRGAFAAAQREWALTTDFERTVAVLKERLADPTADATCETLLVVHEVGGEIDSRLASLAEDRRRDLEDRKDARAKMAGARTARLFVVLVPLGMAVAGLNVGEGREAYRTAAGQALVAVGIGLVAACWGWASVLMRLPVERRVFDR